MHDRLIIHLAIVLTALLMGAPIPAMLGYGGVALITEIVWRIRHGRAAERH